MRWTAPPLNQCANVDVAAVVLLGAGAVVEGAGDMVRVRLVDATTVVATPARRSAARLVQFPRVEERHLADRSWHSFWESLIRL